MAEIDKALPNTKTTIEIPGQTEIEQTIQEEIQPTESPVEINMDEDGGAEISFDPNIAAPQGGEVRRYESKEYNPITGEYVRVIREGSNYLGSGQSDPIVSIFDKEKGFVDIDVPTVDPFSGQQVSAQDQLAFTQTQDIFPQDIKELKEKTERYIDYLKSLNPNNQVPGSAGAIGLPGEVIAREQEALNNILSQYTGKKTTEIPTVDPFSGQQVSLQEAISLAEQMTPPTPAAGYTEEGLRKISEDTASRVNATIDAFNAGLYNQTPTVDPFSGQQVSMQDQMSFTQPQADIFSQQNIPQPPSPVDQFIGERRFQSEADAAARSGIPFTKTIQDYLPNIGFNVPGHMDYFNQIREAGLPTSEYHRLGTADLVQRNIDQLPSILKPIAGALAPVTAFASSIPYELTQASQRMQPGSGIGGFYNAYMNESPLSAASNRFIGAAQPLANQIQNLLSPLASSAQRSQQEAAARVTPRMTMAYGGLTNTIPPAMGPDSQGVESLFKRRYN